MLTQPPVPKLFQPAPAWLPILALLFFTVVCIGLNLGTPLRYGFPLGCFLIGIVLYVRYPILYIGFNWWIWFLSPLVRRLIDFNAGWVDPSPILLAPFLVTFVSSVTLLRNLPKAISGNGFPFVLCTFSVLYGFAIGLAEIPGKVGVIVGLLTWLGPIVFGYHLFANWRQFPDMRQVTQRVFLWSVLIMGIYGVIQFLTAPPWERFWLLNVISITDNYAFGTPAPLQMRVWSTMHSHQPFASVIAAGVLLLLSIQSPFKIASSIAGYLSLLLTLARTAWVGWFLGILVFLPSLKPKLQMRLITTLTIMLVLVAPLAMIEPFSTVINDRVLSFFLGSQDGSYIDRSIGYANLLDEGLTELVGRGVGYEIRDSNIGGNDSGILSLLFTLGWMGSIPYVGGLLLLIVSILRGREATIDPFVSACRAIAVSMFAQIGLNTVMLAAFGMVMWSFIGLSVAARVYHLQQQSSSNAPIIDTLPGLRSPFPKRRRGVSGEES
jgi:hypothetical protein